MRSLTNFYDFRFKWTATAGIGIHPTKAWLSQLVNFKNAIQTWGRTICYKIVLNLEKMSQKRMECFRLLFDYLARIEHQFLSGIRDWRKAGNLWGMMRDVGGVRKSEQPFHQDNAPVHNSILVADYLTKMGIKTIPHPVYSPDLAPCDFWQFPKLRGCQYETIKETKKAVTKVIDTLVQEDFLGAFQRFLKLYNKCIAAKGDYFEWDKSFMCVLSIKVPIRKKSGNLFNDPHISFWY